MSRPKHHVRQEECASRAPYREGRKSKAVKVYTVNQESQYLLVQGVPAVGASHDLLKLFAMHGDIQEHRALDDYPAEQFTDVYLIKYRRIQSARHAKRKLDDWSFYGGVLHVCYAPEYETEEETRWKLQERRRAVAAKIRQYSTDGTYTSTRDHVAPAGSGNPTPQPGAAFSQPSTSSRHEGTSSHSNWHTVNQQQEATANSRNYIPVYGNRDSHAIKQINSCSTASNAEAEHRVISLNCPETRSNKGTEAVQDLGAVEGSHSFVIESGNSTHTALDQSNRRPNVKWNQSNMSRDTSLNQSNIVRPDIVNNVYANGCDGSSKSHANKTCSAADEQQLELPLPPRETKTSKDRRHRQFHFAKVPTAQAEFPTDFDARLDKDALLPATYSNEISELSEKVEKHSDSHSAAFQTAMKSMQEKINENVKKSTGLVIKEAPKVKTAPRFIPRQAQTRKVQKPSAASVPSASSEEGNQELRRNAFILRDVQGPEDCQEKSRKPSSQEISMDKSVKEIRKRIAEVSEVSTVVKKQQKTGT